MISPGSGRVTKLRAPDPILDGRADLSPDGTKVAIGGPGGIWILSRSGGGARRILHAPWPTPLPGDVTWSPSGHELAFTWKKDALYTMDADGKNVKKLLGSRAYAPDWSPARNQIVFVRHPAAGTGAGVIYSIGTDGRDLRPIVWGGHPDVSSDGLELAFDRPLGVYVMSMSGGMPKLVIRNAAYPEWSPNGRYIAFTRTVRCTEAGCTGRAFVAPATGGRAHAIGPRIFDIGSVSWSE